MLRPLGWGYRLKLRPSEEGSGLMKWNPLAVHYSQLERINLSRASMTMMSTELVLPSLEPLGRLPVWICELHPSQSKINCSVPVAAGISITLRLKSSEEKNILTASYRNWIRFVCITVYWHWHNQSDHMIYTRMWHGFQSQHSKQHVAMVTGDNYRAHALAHKRQTPTCHLLERMFAKRGQ